MPVTPERRTYPTASGAVERSPELIGSYNVHVGDPMDVTDMNSTPYTKRELMSEIKILMRQKSDLQQCAHDCRDTIREQALKALEQQHAHL